MASGGPAISVVRVYISCVLWSRSRYLSQSIRFGRGGICLTSFEVLMF